MRVAIQVPSFEEGPSLTRTLRSIRDQPVPDYVSDISYEAWVTPSPQNKSLCDTWQAAMEADGFEVYEAPQGKLTTRNAAHDSAVERGYDVIVTWDADAPPKSENTLPELLEPFGEPGVVAVRGHPMSDWHPFGILENIQRTVLRGFVGHMHGQLSAFTADAWLRAGPFDTDIDQTDIHDVWMEEEYGFAGRLREIGEIRHARGAVVHNDSRRNKCRMQRAFGRSLSGWCEQRGETTFSPRQSLHYREPTWYHMNCGNCGGR